jgi:hypothetical protein
VRAPKIRSERIIILSFRGATGAAPAYMLLDRNYDPAIVLDC